MKDILQDIVAHTHALGSLNLLKITATSTDTTIDSITDDRNIILYAKTHSPVKEFSGVFGMGNLDKLNLHLKNPEYKENATLNLVEEDRNGIKYPTYIHFENQTGDFKNDYRFVNKAIIEQKIKNAKFKGATWDIEFTPSIASIARLKLMSAAHAEEPTFNVFTHANNLIFSFGDTTTHAGQFVFESNVKGTLKKTWIWPISEIQSILNLNGDIFISISDQGLMKISIDSGLVLYDYYVPVHVK